MLSVEIFVIILDIHFQVVYVFYDIYSNCYYITAYKMLTELQLSDTELKNLTLIEIENMMQSNRRSLHEFTCMPYPDSYVTKHVGNRLIYDELDYNAEKEQKNFEELFHALTGDIFYFY